MLREGLDHLPHRIVQPAMTCAMRVARRPRERLRHDQRERLHDHRIPRRPQVSLVAVVYGDPSQQADLRGAGEQVCPPLGLFVRPVAAEAPHIGVGGPVLALLTQPRIGRFQYCIADQVRHGESPRAGTGVLGIPWRVRHRSTGRHHEAPRGPSRCM